MNLEINHKRVLPGRFWKNIQRNINIEIKALGLGSDPAGQKSDAKIMAWWDYGYQIGTLANRTTVIDNNAWNNTHIGLVARALTANESVAYPILQQVEVIFKRLFHSLSTYNFLYMDIF